MKKITVQYIIFCVSILAFTHQAEAQLEHGNGSRVMSGSRYDYWSTAKSDWVISDSMKYEYNANNDLVLITQRKYDQNFASWNITKYTVIKYDQNGNQLLYLDSNLEPAYFSWRGKAVSEYNPDNTVKQSTRYSWNTNTNSWQAGIRYLYTYNSAGKQSTVIIEKYFPHRKAMVPENKYSYTYNADGLYDMILSENWDTINNAWVLAYRSNSLYNSDKQELMYKGEEYKNNVWVNSHKVEWIYNSDKQISSRTDFQWEAGKSDWVASLKNSFYYDDKKYLEAVVSTWWNEGTGKWDNYSSSQYGLNLFGWPVSYLYSQWDGGAAKWVYNTKRASKFDNVGYETYRFTQMWDKTNSVFVNNSRQSWSYQDKNTASADVVEHLAPLTVYPNPATDLLDIRLTAGMKSAVRFTFHDATGKLVYSTEEFVKESGAHTLRLNRAVMPSGMYVLSATDGNHRSQTRIIIR